MPYNPAPAGALETVRRVVLEPLKAAPIPDDAVPDLVADLQAAERELASFRRSLIDEAPGPVEGELWKLVETRKADRYYNESALLRDLTPEGGYVPETLMRLVAKGVVKLSWQWRKLQKEADEQNMTLAIAKHEVADGDEAHVGEVWSTKLEPKPKT